MKTWQIILISVFSAMAAAALILLISKPPTTNYIILPTRQPPQPSFVYVTGAVSRPGTYELPIGSRVDDLVTAAGGLTTLADSSAINLAALINDGQHIHVPVIGESYSVNNLSSTSPDSTSAATLDTAHPININTASISDLERLPGIGATRAQDIIIYRDIHGLFAKIEDLMNVPGIGETTFNNLKDYITVQETTP